MAAISEGGRGSCWAARQLQMRTQTPPCTEESRDIGFGEGLSPQAQAGRGPCACSVAGTKRETNPPDEVPMSFRAVFIALVIGFGLVLAAYLLNRQRPAFETDQPSESFVKATGKCAECHTRQHYSVVHEYEMSVHAKKGVNCLECHQQVASQQVMEHHGFTLSKSLTSANCKGCHPTQYEQFAHSRHAAP